MLLLRITIASQSRPPLQYPLTDRSLPHLRVTWTSCVRWMGDNRIQQWLRMIGLMVWLMVIGIDMYWLVIGKKSVTKIDGRCQWLASWLHWFLAAAWCCLTISVWQQIIGPLAWPSATARHESWNATAWWHLLTPQLGQVDQRVSWVATCFYRSTWQLGVRPVVRSPFWHLDMNRTRIDILLENREPQVEWDAPQR